MDAREALRRYLEQRREFGESELMLDSMSVDEAMKLLGAHKPPPSAGRGSSPAPSARAVQPPPPVHVDWRTALRESGAEDPMANRPVRPASPPPPPPPTERVPRGELLSPSQAAHVPDTQAPEKKGSPFAEIPAGLSVGGASRALADDPAAKLGSLEEIAAVIAACTRCKLYATAINPVPGTGSSNADLVVVGEAPGATEDEQGVPFVGQAGQLLTKILEAIQLKREDVFIVNVLKHRPPANRNPLPDEVVACSPYLVRQIELVRPKAILALGTFAAQTLLETKLTIGKLRSQIHRYYGVPLVVTYHPAALLRNPSWKRPTWEDVQLARRILDSTDASGA